MAFLGAFTNRVAQTFNRIKSQIASITRSSDANINSQTRGQGSGMRATLEIKTADATGTAYAAITVYLNQQVQAALAKEIGEFGVQAVRDALEPIKRTGTLQDSFKYRFDSSNNAVVIFSELPQASSIQTGIRRAGSTQSLQDWLQTKPEHRGKTEAELKRLSFNIRRKIARGDAPGPGSTLRNLSPQGERRYDYLGVATRQIEEQIELLLNGVAL